MSTTKPAVWLKINCKPTVKTNCLYQNHLIRTKYVTFFTLIQQTQSHHLTILSICVLPFSVEEIQSAAVPPKFVKKIQKVEVTEGHPARFDCKVTGSPRPEIKWYLEGKEIASSPYMRITDSPDGTSSLVIQEVFADDSGRFTVKASNPAGEVTCSTLLVVEGKFSKFVHVELLNRKKCCQQSRDFWINTRLITFCAILINQESLVFIIFQSKPFGRWMRAYFTCWNFDKNTPIKNLKYGCTRPVCSVFERVRAPKHFQSTFGRRLFF